MARKYKLTNDVFVMCENDKDCVFCDHCTDIFWDFLMEYMEFVAS